MMLSLSSFASSYTINDSEVDALFENAVETQVSSMELLSESNAMNFSNTAKMAEMDPTAKIAIACIVDYVGLGAFGVHRYVLGTKSSMWAIYTFTVCGIFGIVPTVDFWVLLIDGLVLKNQEKYLDNEKFFMWF